MLTPFSASKPIIMETPFLRAFLGASLLMLLSSCYDSGLYYPAGGYPAGSYGGYASTTYSSYGGVGPYGYRGWGSPYYGRYGGYGRYYDRYDHHHHDDDHRDHRHSQSASSSNSRDRQYRIISGNLDGKKKPNDFHSLDWYHDRGYSLEKLKIETDRGAVIDKRPSSQKSSNSRSSSSRDSSSSASKSGSSSSSSNSRQVTTKPSDMRSHIINQLSKKK